MRIGHNPPSIRLRGELLFACVPHMLHDVASSASGVLHRLAITAPHARGAGNQLSPQFAHEGRPNIALSSNQQMHVSVPIAPLVYEQIFAWSAVAESL